MSEAWDGQTVGGSEGTEDGVDVGTPKHRGKRRDRYIKSQHMSINIYRKGYIISKHKTTNPSQY